MGNLIKVLGKDLENCPHFFLDFESFTWGTFYPPRRQERDRLRESRPWSVRAARDAQLCLSFPSGGGEVRRGTRSALSPENALRSLLEALTSPPYAPTQHLEREQALAKQFAEILHFTLSFDELKMTNPAIQNDFRDPPHSHHAGGWGWKQQPGTVGFQNKTLPIEDTTDCLSTMACVCRVMLETPEYRSRFTNTETLLFCMRVMVGVIILYDHVHPVGAFAKTSKIDMKGCIKVLKDQPSTSTEGLLNALRYTTRHLNDDTTSKQIRALLQ
ncbi:PREDICTED: protein FAM49A [Corvus brachyrhynchos]|uniref:protein FAM49A n=1 Tax=Corvus brachyrhynchos TaxID=85066 RepID=UPI0008165E55|nr:PREDICTED: protein FAM49A [Corvus brachyrhynchos]